MDFVRKNSTLLLIGLVALTAYLAWNWWSNNPAIAVGKRILEATRMSLVQAGCSVEGNKVKCMGGISIPGLGSEFTLKDAGLKSCDALQAMLSNSPPPQASHYQSGPLPPPGAGGGGYQQAAPSMGVPMGGHAMPPSSEGGMGGMGGSGAPPGMAPPQSTNQTSLGGGDSIGGGLMGASGF